MPIPNPDKNKINPPQSNVKDLDRRRRLTDQFIKSEFYKLYFEPEIQKEIENNDKLSKISESDDPKKVYNEYWKLKNRVQIYRGILNKLKEWSK